VVTRGRSSRRTECVTPLCTALLFILGGSSPSHPIPLSHRERGGALTAGRPWCELCREATNCVSAPAGVPPTIPAKQSPPWPGDALSCADPPRSSGLNHDLSPPLQHGGPCRRGEVARRGGCLGPRAPERKQIPPDAPESVRPLGNSQPWVAQSVGRTPAVGEGLWTIVRQWGFRPRGRERGPRPGAGARRGWGSIRPGCRNNLCRQR
jgi:hypothetical protein